MFVLIHAVRSLALSLSLEGEPLRRLVGESNNGTAHQVGYRRTGRVKKQPSMYF